MTRTLGFCLLAALLAAASCDGGRSPASPTAPPSVPAPSGGSLHLETIIQQSIPAQTGGTVREVVRDEAAWRSLWAQLRAGSALPAQPPAVDFSHDMVIAAAMETQSCVSRVTIRSAVQTGGELVIDLLEAPPAPNCVCITSERPIHVVRLPKVEAPERFTVETGRTPC